MANNVPIILQPKHDQAKTHTAKTDNKQPPTTATPRLLLPEEERQPRAILKTRARPLQPGAPETQVLHSPNQRYHLHPRPYYHNNMMMMLLF